MRRALLWASIRYNFYMDDAPGKQKLELEGGNRMMRKAEAPQRKQKSSVLETVAKGQGRFDPTNEGHIYGALIRNMIKKSEAIKAASVINSGSPSRPSPRAWSIDAQGRKYLPGSTKGGTEEFLKNPDRSFSDFLKRSTKI